MTAATGMFAGHGFTGATVDAIAGSAGVNMRMINHYFGDKCGLYVAVLEELLGELREAELHPIKGPGSATDGLIGIYQTIFDHFGNSPQLVRSLSTENVMFARFLKSSVATPVVASLSLRNIEALLKRGQQDGSIRRKIVF
ncbi:TetR family transcriptional regulator [Rhodobacteraceae bacterium 2376]|uniref:TetR family transcriptional regulator n=1 Tax=Rhabdonatronobacter sediminivivens TaxID=2743469 RepID=A0A7Z0I2K6_9RHOB|nr:TetR family transcriptional regulator [Rhabdonatronobacter sediminivivens]NYS26773.1 TetR family transcriptional regulator [Rhabdonatronobacter sediminivivens]